MGIESGGGKTPESSFEKRIRINQELTKLRARLATEERGTELANAIYLEIAEKEKAIALLDGAPSKDVSPSGGPTLGAYKKKEETTWGDTHNRTPSDRGGNRHDGGQTRAPF